METTVTDVVDNYLQDALTNDQNEQKQQNNIKTLNNIIIPNINEKEEELLGSVNIFQVSGNDGQAVRTSARVIHKLKMPPITQPEKKETQNENSPANPPKPITQTKPHVRTQWTNEERIFFFDALNEYGRDFEQISRYINAKMKRKTSSEQDYKTKDHVRQIYYQLFQKASKYLRFSDDVKKVPQELYTLINFGEMKRKLVMSSEKSFLKLRDLVYKGSVTIRLKGKNIKVKTPCCRALRKLNQLEGNIEDVLLPQRIDVILRPTNMQSWGYVQGLAQNPRVRMISLPLQKRVATIIHTMQQKWQTVSNRLYEKHLNNAIQRHSVQRIGEDIIKQSQIDLVQLKKEQPILCFMPPRDTVIHRPMVQLKELISRYNICLNAYEERIGAKTKGETLSSEKIAHFKDLLKHPSKRMRFDSASEKNAKAKNEEQQKLVKTSNENGVSVIDYKSNDSIDEELKRKEVKSEEANESKLQHKNGECKNEDMKEAAVTSTPPITFPSFTPKVEETESKPQILPSTPTQQSGNHITKPNKKKESQINGNNKNSKENVFKPLIDEKTLKTVRKGWTIETVGDLTIGDLYLMFGSDSRLVLEYDCFANDDNKSEPIAEPNVSKVESKRIGNKLKNLLAIANLMEGSANSAMFSHFTNHACERTVNDSSYIDQPFKQPIGPMLNPRSKAHQSRWRVQHRLRPIGNHIMDTGLSGNHVVRDLYQTPPPPKNDQKSKEPEKKLEDVTQIIEEKIQHFSGTTTPNIFSDTSRSSMRSLLENFWSNTPIKNQICDDVFSESSFSIRLLEENVKSSTDDLDSLSNSSFFKRLENDIKNDQGLL